MKKAFTLFASIAVGLIIFRIDSQPNWDDTGITAGMLLIGTGVISFISPRKSIIWAIATSIWIPLFGIIKDHHYGSLLALLFGFIGAYVGSGLRRSFQSMSS